MTLEATLTYLVALAVPLWLLVEQFLSRRHSREEEPRQQGHHDEPARREATGVVSSEVPESAVAGDLRRRAA